MTVRAISHQIVIAIQSTSDGSTARHPHDTVDLLFSCCVMTQHQTFSMHPLTNFHRSNNRYTRQRPKPRFHSSQKCHDFASIFVFAALQLPLRFSCLPRICSASILMQLRFLQMLNCCCHCRLLTAHCPYSSRIGRIFRKYSAQIWSTDQHTADFIRFKMKGPNRMVLPHSDSIMSPIYRVQVEQLLWRLLTAALRFIMGFLVLDRNIKDAS